MEEKEKKMIDKLIAFVIGMIVGAVALFAALAIYAWRKSRRGIQQVKK